jgi:hypothetical protein
MNELELGSLALRVVNCRNGGAKALMACDLALGHSTPDGGFTGLFTIPGFFLKRSAKGLYFNGPSKPAVDYKTKEPIMENGYQKQDEFFRLFMEMGANPKNPGKLGVTKASWTARDHLIALMEKAYHEFSGETDTAEAVTSGRGGDDWPF